MKQFIFLLFFSSFFIACADVPTLTNKHLDMRGVDISYFDQIETSGIKFYKDNKESSLFSILHDSGVNWVRLRLWHTPLDGWNNLEKTILMAKRVKENGFNFLLDIHYSDTWADPSNQKPPKAWNNLNSIEDFSNAVEHYTSEVIDSFIKFDCLPDMVQVGNEITGGILYPYCSIKDGDCTNLFKVLDVACRLIRNKCPKSKIMLHIDRGGDNNTAVWWFSKATDFNIDYDVIGLSYYSFFHGTDLLVVSENIQILKKMFEKDVCIVETSYMWTTFWNDNRTNLVGENADFIKDFEISAKGQKKYLRALCNSVYESGGSGVFWWEPDAVCGSGFESDIENLTWFDFSNNYNTTGDVFNEFK